MFPASECIAWLTVFGIETAAIVMLNALTIIVYLKERSLRKRSMYLVINQAVADMLVGASVIFQCWLLGRNCYFWTIHFFIAPFSTGFFVLWVFPSASLINLTAISLERTHATVRPFKHRLVKTKIFGAVITVVWITAGLVASTRGLHISQTLTLQLYDDFLIAFYSFFGVCLIIIVVSYSSIARKIVCGTQCHHHGATSRERKLTKTLFLVTAVSLLLTLPFIILKVRFIVASYFRPSRMISPRTRVWLHYSLIFLFYTNSLVNPILYTYRIPGFRRALFSILHCRSQTQPAPGFPLNEM
ncbi:substance-K receptor-like [Acropora palmata]|uniref:substance-K receptor-like n=1 Tax=Acropora palmata TaxID=6131 RepID=UPI003D9FD88B